MQRLFDLFSRAGHELYLVGGAVRDLHLGRRYEDLVDLDFATSCTPEETTRVLKDGGYSVFKLGWAFGTVGTVLQGAEAEGYPKQVQVTTYRSAETYRPGSRHPEVTFGESLEADLGRRDLTINAMAQGVDGVVVDLHGGRDDLAARRLRLLGEPEATLREDPLRLLRVARFISQLGFEPTRRVRAACHACAPCILDISRERWFQEMDRLLVGGSTVDALQLLYETRVLGFILPEVAALVGLHKTSRHHHKDVWAHTKAVVSQAPLVPAVRWAALLHDIGKPWTRDYGPGGKVHFLRHEDLGAVLFEGVAHRFRFDNRLRRRVRFLIKNHLRGNLYDGTWTDSAVRRFMKDMGEHLEDLLVFTKADITSANPMRRERNVALASELMARCVEVAEKDGQEPALPKGVGNAIMERFGLPPGRHIGDLRRALEEAVIREELPAQAEEEVYLAWLEGRGLVAEAMAASESRGARGRPSGDEGGDP